MLTCGLHDSCVGVVLWRGVVINALLAVLEPRPPFGVLIVAELSRIGRDTVRTPAAVLQLEEAGAVTGGRVFGYVNHRNGDGYVHRVIDDNEAAVIRRIFSMYAEGAGLVRIAKTLNAEHVPPPRVGSGSWAPTAVREMLRRPLYAGVMVWNKSQKVMRREPKGSESADARNGCRVRCPIWPSLTRIYGGASRGGSKPRGRCTCVAWTAD